MNQYSYYDTMRWLDERGNPKVWLDLVKTSNYVWDRWVLKFTKCIPYLATMTIFILLVSTWGILRKVMFIYLKPIFQVWNIFVRRDMMIIKPINAEWMCAIRLRDGRNIPHDHTHMNRVMVWKGCCDIKYHFFAPISHRVQIKRIQSLESVRDISEINANISSSRLHASSLKDIP